MENKKDLHIDATKVYPEIHFGTEGAMHMRGRFISDELQDFFDRLNSWVVTVAPPNVTINIELEYLNTSAAFRIADMLQKIEQNPEINSIDVIWHYEEDDEDHYDLGELIRDKLTRSGFSFNCHTGEDLE